VKDKFINSGKKAAGAVVMIVVALLIGAILVILSGNSPFEAYSTIISGAFGSKQRLSELFVKMIPLTIMAYGVSIAFKAQLWNIGADGQFIIGAIASAAIGIYVNLPSYIIVPVSVLSAMLAGALWAGLAGWLKTKFNANEVITTLMFNYIATYFLAFLVYGPMMDPNGELAQSKVLNDSLKIPLLFSNLRIHGGIIIMILIIVLMFFFWKTSLGYKVDLIGQGEKVSTYAGVNVKKTIIITMMISGAFAGLAGWNETYGVQYRLLEGISSGYGDIAVVIALLGELNPLGIVVSSFFFSILKVGGASMQRMTNVPYSIVDVIQGLIIIFVIARTAFKITPIKEWIGRRKNNVK
jgi:simple sugar transport system permease protein